MQLRGRAFVGALFCVVALSCGGDGDSGAEGTASALADATSRAEAGVVLEATPTPRPSPTPQPTAPASAIDVPAGWKKFSGESFSIWLPPSYEGGEPSSEDFELALEVLRSIGDEDLINAAESSRGSMQLWMFDNLPERLGNNVSVLVQPLPSAISLEGFVEATLVQLKQSGFIVIEQSFSTLGGRDAARVLLDASVLVPGVTTLQYYLRTPSDIWVVTFSCFWSCDSQIPAIDQSADTIRITE